MELRVFHHAWMWSVSRRQFDCISEFMDLSIVFCEKLVVIFYGFWVVIVKRYYNELLIIAQVIVFCFPLFYSL